MKRITIGLVASLVIAAVAHATPIQIQMTGVDLSYDGSTITSAMSPDDLTSVVINGTTTFISDISLDVTVPNVTGLAANSPSSATSDAGGNLLLSLPGGDFADLMLDQVKISFIDTNAGISTFIFAATTAAVNGQQLPGGLELMDPVSVSFSTQVNTMTDDGVNITSFTSSGTGELQSVPEPAAMTMVLLAVAGMIGIYRRK